MDKKHSNFEPTDGIHRPFATSFENESARVAHTIKKRDDLKWFFQQDISSLFAQVDNGWQEISLSMGGQKVHSYEDEIVVEKQKQVFHRKLGLQVGQVLLWNFEVRSMENTCSIRSLFSFGEKEISSQHRTCTDKKGKIFGLKRLEFDNPYVGIELEVTEGKGCIFSSPRFLVLE